MNDLLTTLGTAANDWAVNGTNTFLVTNTDGQEFTDAMEKALPEYEVKLVGSGSYGGVKNLVITKYTGRKQRIVRTRVAVTMSFCGENSIENSIQKITIDI